MSGKDTACDDQPGPVMLYACSCGTNVGQLANEGTRLVSSRGFAKMACLPGIAIRNENSIVSAKKARKLIVVDGCAMRCGCRILEAAGYFPGEVIVVTDLGIVKSVDLQLKPEDVEKVSSAILSKV